MTKPFNLTKRVADIAERVDALHEYDAALAELVREFEGKLDELEAMEPATTAALAAVDVDTRRALALELEQQGKELDELETQDAALDEAEEAAEEE